MSINRAAILTQLLNQLQQALATSEIHIKLAELLKTPVESVAPIEVSLLRQAATPATQARVVLSVSDEQIANDATAASNEAQAASLFGRKIQLHVSTQLLPTDAKRALALLDLLAEHIELALTLDDTPKPWLCVRVKHTDFTFTDSGDDIHASMMQHFSVSYQVEREDEPSGVPVSELYLSNQGGPYELAATLPTD